ncbi:MAG: hypothetical protein K6C94_07790 [Candidatus Gastranaerophilales bacterium]|nr:hypothetical protein [Candidatus Gastranaerophilales bacterium]
MTKEEELKMALKDLIEITRVVVLYTNGAPAESCIERITNIIISSEQERNLLMNK